MPTYEYKCDHCEYKFEEFQSITADPIKKCPECGKNKVRRLLGIGSAVIFKGSGFYETDYRSESYKKSAKADTDSVSTTKKDATATEKKPGDNAKKEPVKNKSKNDASPSL
ncbi:MAG: zinc ribbon domain-containing protein [Phycisphaerae bacterium]|nr:zinc ribbon domain-containing protein [Phycisphaerae bacterium]